MCGPPVLRLISDPGTTRTMPGWISLAVGLYGYGYIEMANQLYLCQNLNDDVVG
jgi:hypothetical protein